MSARLHSTGLARYLHSFEVTNGCERHTGLTGMGEHFDEPNVKEMQGYIEDRSSVLKKVFTDHVFWERSLRAFGKDACLAATWVDHQGKEHVFAINRLYLKAHLKIVRSLMNDLIASGPEGKRALQSILSLQISMLEEEETG